MPKFIVKASYGVEGIRGLIKEGGTGSRAAVQKLIEDVVRDPKFKQLAS